MPQVPPQSAHPEELLVVELVTELVVELVAPPLPLAGELPSLRSLPSTKSPPAPSVLTSGPVADVTSLRAAPPPPLLELPELYPSKLKISAHELVLSSNATTGDIHARIMTAPPLGPASIEPVASV
jgi:hypothetical protein